VEPISMALERRKRTLVANLFRKLSLQK